MASPYCRDTAAQALLDAYPGLILEKHHPELSDRQRATRNLRTILKKEFPRIPFKVTSRATQNGDVSTLSVAWIRFDDGPVGDSIQSFANDFSSLFSKKHRGHGRFRITLDP